MGIFNFGKKSAVTAPTRNEQAEMAEMVLNSISDGVIITDGNGVIRMINPAAATMTGYGNPASAVGLDYQLVLKLQNSEGRAVTDAENPIMNGIRTNTAFSSRDYLLVAGGSERQMAIALNFFPTSGAHGEKVITFRDITKELEEESEQASFISTASHEMRTPVASIEGYLGLALNPQTATIDDRARQYLTAAHNSSQHLGELFKDLLDVTKLDDGRLKPTLTPVEMTSTVRQIADRFAPILAQHKLNYSFGSAEGADVNGRKLNQLLYANIDVSFLTEILDNLIGNAAKYTPEGGGVWVNVQGDGDRVLINVTDTGIGISTEDLGHVFQKFYRVDNSETRKIGGTGLGLYLVKQRTEAMGGRVWAESQFGEGSTFYVSLPRLSAEDYSKQVIAAQNAAAMQQFRQNK